LANLSDDTSRFDSNRPTGVSGKGDAKGREHAHRRNIDTVGTRHVVGGQDGGNDEEGTRQSGDHADTEASDDDGGRSGLASSGGGLDEGEGARREALGGLADQHTYEKADDDAAKYFPASFYARSSHELIQIYLPNMPPIASCGSTPKCFPTTTTNSYEICPHLNPKA
jgi:hypothetical protein